MRRLMMAFVDEFDTQWNSIIAFLESEMINQSEKSGWIDLQDIERKFENEKKRWSVPGQYNYAWLELLKKKDPEIAEEFIRAIEKNRLEQVKVEMPNSSASIIIPAVGGAAIGFAAGYLINHGIILTCIVTIPGCTIGGIIGNTINQRKKSQIVNDAKEQYVTQLKEMKRNLRAIVQKADA